MHELTWEYDWAPDPGSGSASWQSNDDVHQESHSHQTLDKTTTRNQQGEWETTGTDLRVASAGGTADWLYDSEWEEKHQWSAYSSSASGGTYHQQTHDQYDYDYSRDETFNANGTSTVAETETNHVTGTLTGSSSHW